MSEKLDFKKKYKDHYLPTHKQFSIVDIPEAVFLMIDGQGAPAGPDYEKCVQWLYSVAYPIKFMAKKELGREFVVPPLEGLWWADDWSAYLEDRRDEWKWRLMIRLPDWDLDSFFGAALEKAEKKLGAKPESLHIEKFAEGLCAQIMHIGPYSEEAPTIAKMHDEFIPENGYKLRGLHHEIYLSDPRRSAPEKLKTVLRQPIEKV